MDNDYRADRRRNRYDRDSLDQERGGFAHRDFRQPEVFAVTNNLPDNWLLAGETIRVHMRATPGGKAFFRIRGIVGEVKMNEVAPGVYEGSYRNDTNHDIEIARRDVLAFVTVGDRASAETPVGGSTRMDTDR